MDASNAVLSAAICIPCLRTGGTEVASLDLAVGLAECGYQVSVIVYFDEVEAGMAAAFAAAGVRIVRLNCRRSPGIRARLDLAWKLQRALLRRGFHLIWLQYMTPTVIPLSVARMATRCLIAQVHVAPQHFDGPALARLRWIARRICTRVVCGSQFTAQGIFGRSDATKTCAKWARERIAVLPMSAKRVLSDDVAPRSWRQELGWNPEVAIVGYIGRLVHLKGVDTLLYALQKALERGAGARLVVVGDGEDRPILEAMVDQLQLSQFVFFTGTLTRAQVSSAIRGFDILVVPSREEGFGLSTLEGMALGVPVIASNVDALPEVISDGRTGLFFGVDNVAELAERITYLIAHPVVRRAMGEAARLHVQSAYSWAGYTERLVDILKPLVPVGKLQP